MTNSIPARLPHLLPLLASILALACTTGCAIGDDADPPGADASVVPLDPSGTFEVRSMFHLRAAPGGVTETLGELHAATDGPDDPSRYLVDLVVARLSEGNPRELAELLAPYVASYVNERLDEVAPALIDGLRALTTGLDRIATRFGTLERLRIETDGRARRTIAGLHLEGVDLPFVTLGLPDVTADTRVVLAGTRLELRGHVTHLAHGALLRIGLDQVVIPRVVPGARDLADALHALVACPRLGEVIAEAIGLGEPSLYAQACTLGLTVAAAALYDRLPPAEAPLLALELVGTARAVDRDGDGTLEVLEAGTWTGLLDGVPLGDSTFEGTRRCPALHCR